MRETYRERGRGSYVDDDDDDDDDHGGVFGRESCDGMGKDEFITRKGVGGRRPSLARNSFFLFLPFSLFLFSSSLYCLSTFIACDTLFVVVAGST